MEIFLPRDCSWSSQEISQTIRFTVSAYFTPNVPRSYFRSWNIINSIYSISIHSLITQFALGKQKFASPFSFRNMMLFAIWTSSWCNRLSFSYDEKKKTKKKQLRKIPIHPMGVLFLKFYSVVILVKGKRKKGKDSVSKSRVDKWKRKRVWRELNLSYVYVNAIIRAFFGESYVPRQNKNEAEWKCESLDNLLLLCNSRLSCMQRNQMEERIIEGKRQRVWNLISLGKWKNLSVNVLIETLRRISEIIH